MLHLPSFFWEEFSYVARLKKNTLRKQDRGKGESGVQKYTAFWTLSMREEGLGEVPQRRSPGATVEVTGRKENRTPS